MECYLNVWLTVLAILTTVLLGWQIYTAIFFELRLAKATAKLKTELTKQYQLEIGKARNDATSMALAQLGLALRNKSATGGAFTALMNALIHANLGADEQYDREVKGKTIEMLYEMVSSDDAELCNLPKSSKDLYVTAASKIESTKEKEAILKFILAAEIIEETQE